MNVKVKAYDPFGGDMSSVTFDVVVDGRHFVVERWADNNSSGSSWAEYVDKTIRSVDLPPEVEDEIDEALTEAEDRYWTRVTPAIEQIHRELFGQPVPPKFTSQAEADAWLEANAPKDT